MIGIDIIKDALTITGHQNFGEDPDPDASALGLRCLNGLLGELSTKTYYNPQQGVVSITSTGSDVYTLGTDPDTGVPGDFPSNYTHIQEVHIEQGPTVFNIPMKSLGEYERVPNKATTGIPNVCGWDRQYPVGRLYFWPCPSGTTITIIGTQMIPLLASVQDNVELPPTYWTALVYGTAIRMAPMMPTMTREQIDACRQTYHSSLTGIRTEINNMRTQIMRNGYQSARRNRGSYWTWNGRTL